MGLHSASCQSRAVPLPSPALFMPPSPRDALLLHPFHLLINQSSSPLSPPWASFPETSQNWFQAASPAPLAGKGRARNQSVGSSPSPTLLGQQTWAWRSASVFLSAKWDESASLTGFEE